MSIIVDHEGRRRAVLESAVRLFVEEGYPGVTYRKIADRCGLARTGLYRYFRTKREIFDHAIRYMTDELLRELSLVGADADRPVAERLETVLTTAIDGMFRLKAMLSMALEYLLRQQSQPDAIGLRVREYAVRVRLLLRTLVREGIRRGELAAVRPGAAADMLFALLEAAVLEVTVSGMLDVRQFERMVQLSTRRLLAVPDGRPALPA